jgi:HD-GYP domain-containing protein (c-di-GMP phosphodiesterase class II)/pSer/pThr/pTyr-binding forkhead associated (FHA) protein
MVRQRIRLRGIGPELKETAWESDRLLRIGRLPSLEVLVNDPSISRIHAEIILGDKGWVVRDLGSTNGTFLNGIRVGRADHKLNKCDLLQCGNIVIFVEELIEEGKPVCERALNQLKIEATANQTWEEAVEYLALDVTRRSRPAEQLLALLRAGHQLHQFTSAEEWLRISLQDAALSLGAQRGAIVLIDEITQELSVQAVYMGKPSIAGGCYHSETVAQRCLARGESLLISNIQEDPDLLLAPSVANGAMSSIICALLRSSRRRLGVLHLNRGFTQEAFSRDDLRLADAIAVHLSDAIESGRLLQEKQQDLFVQTVIALAQAIEMRDEYTGGHTQRVTDYSLLLADELRLSAPDCRSLRVGAPIHDIGKIGIDDAVLRKRDKLTPAEFNHMKTHTLKGAAILETIPDLKNAVTIARNHHERWDGSGYPDGLAGDRIPFLARVVAVADTFDAMTTDRPYRAGMIMTDALDQIREAAGGQLDPDCAKAFLSLRPQIQGFFEERWSTEKTMTFHAKLGVSIQSQRHSATA